jgi:hypothetical protein
MSWGVVSQAADGHDYGGDLRSPFLAAKPRGLWPALLDYVTGMRFCNRPFFLEMRQECAPSFTAAYNLFPMDRALGKPIHRDVPSSHTAGIACRGRTAAKCRSGQQNVVMSPGRARSRWLPYSLVAPVWAPGSFAQIWVAPAVWSGRFLCIYGWGSHSSPWPTGPLTSPLAIEEVVGVTITTTTHTTPATTTTTIAACIEA